MFNDFRRFWYKNFIAHEQIHIEYVWASIAHGRTCARMTQKQKTPTRCSINVRMRFYEHDLPLVSQIGFEKVHTNNLKDHVLLCIVHCTPEGIMKIITHRR